MKNTSELTPKILFDEFRSAYNNPEIGIRALDRFKAVQEKSAFLEPTIEFLASEEEDTIRSWGTNILREIRGTKASEVLIKLLREPDSPERGGKFQKASAREIKRKYRYTRFFALQALAQLVKSDNEHHSLLALLERIWQDDDEDYLIQAEASILLVKKGKTEALTKLKKMLGSYKEDFWATARALRALREFPLPDLVDEIILVMRNSDYGDHQYDAISALGSFKDDTRVVRALGEVSVTNSNAWAREAAVKSLSRLQNPAARADLIQCLHDHNAEIRVQASKALTSALSEKDAISIIVQEALNPGIGKVVRDDLVDALRRIDPERKLSTEILSNEMASDDPTRTQLAQEILAYLGGWAAIQKLGQRRKTLESLDKLLGESEQVIKKTFEDTIRQARLNFYFAMGVNVLVVLVGIALVVLAIYQLTQRPDKLEAWIVPGGAGVLGVIINLAFNNPRHNAREDLTALVDVTVIFLGFLRQLNEIDATFKHAYIESRDFGPVQMNEAVTHIENAVAQTLNMAKSHLLDAQKTNKEGQNKRSAKDEQEKTSIQKLTS